MKLSEISFERAAAFTVTAAGVILLLHLYLRTLIAAALPFLLAWLMAYLVRPVALFLHRRLRLPTGPTCAALVFLSLLAVGTGLFFLARRAVLELWALGERLTADTALLDRLCATLAECRQALCAHLPLLGVSGQGEITDELLSAALAKGVDALASAATRAAGTLMSLLPLWMIFILVTLVASFYFAVDLGGIHRAVLAMLPPRWGAFAVRLKEGAFLTAVGYLRSYLLLMLISFLLLVGGFLILRVEYALLLAALFAVLDFLPVIGMELLLLPWGILSLVGGDPARGIGLILLYAVITAVRQLAEPRIVGYQLGLHPLMALLASYVGLRLFGVLGMMLLPAALLTLRHLREGESDPKAAK